MMTQILGTQLLSPIHAFATGKHIPASAEEPRWLTMLPRLHLNVFFAAVAECVEESILNALMAAETTAKMMMGYKRHTAHAMSLYELRRVMKKYGRV